MDRYPRQISGPAPISKELLKRLNGLIDTDWKGQTKDIKAFKEAVKTYLIGEQGMRCAYCGLPFSFTSPQSRHLDHIAPKSIYKNWTFEPSNLVLSCDYCNSSRKGEKDFVVPPAKSDCLKCDYEIIHPYLDEFNDLIDWPYDSYPSIRENLTTAQHDKAEQTIELFDLSADYKVTRRNIYHLCSDLEKVLSILDIIGYTP